MNSIKFDLKRYWRVLGIIIGGLLVIGVMAACSSGKTQNTAYDATGVPCASVSTQLASAQASLATDQAAAEAKKGTPDEKTANEVVAKETQYIADLKTRQGSKECTGTGAPTSAAASSCATWQMSDNTPANNNILADGVPEIKAATTPEAAKAAAGIWLNGNPAATPPTPGAKNFTQVLSGSNQVLSPSHAALDTTKMVDAKGCATQYTVDAVNALTTALALYLITPDSAPSGGTNTGTSGGVIVAATSPGVSGDLSAIKITMPNGSVWIMARCGNFVLTGPVPFKPSPVVPLPAPPAPTPTPSRPATCVEVPGVESCGKHQSYAPVPTGDPVVLPPSGGYVDPTGGVQTTPYVPPVVTPTDPSTQGSIDSGRGANSTTTAPAAPTTVAAPITAAPTASNQPAP